jgi:predicted Zn-dependent protease with MMP-like domain
VSGELSDWNNVQAPSVIDLDRMAQAAFAALPEEFRRLCGAS